MSKVTMRVHDVKARLFRNTELPKDYTSVLINDPTLSHTIIVCCGRTKNHPAMDVNKVLTTYLKSKRLGLIRKYGSHNVYTGKKNMTVKICPPSSCDICKHDLKSGDTFYDASLQGPPCFGRWGWVCKKCFTSHDGKLGTGWGQEYSSKTNKKLRG